jgi:hypothetical protein
MNDFLAEWNYPKKCGKYRHTSSHDLKTEYQKMSPPYLSAAH